MRLYPQDEVLKVLRVLTDPQHHTVIISPMPVRSAAQERALDGLARDLEGVFGPRLASLVAYAAHDGDDTLHTLALIEGLTFRDLTACLPLADGWRRRGLAVPLMLSQAELSRTVDIFPLEYSSIISSHAVVRGRNPFDGIRVPSEDIRRACEAQAKSHLIHLREGFLESHGEAAVIGQLIVRSAGPFRALIANIARLPDNGRSTTAVAPVSDDVLAQVAESRMGVPAALVHDVLTAATTGQMSIADPSALLARYLEAAQRMWDYVDTWRA